jgi:hypothetical protein
MIDALPDLPLHYYKVTCFYEQGAARMPQRVATEATEDPITAPSPRGVDRGGRDLRVADLLAVRHLTLARRR